jgi:hypothetical protein
MAPRAPQPIAALMMPTTYAYRLPLYGTVSLPIWSMRAVETQPPNPRDNVITQRIACRRSFARRYDCIDGRP